MNNIIITIIDIVQNIVTISLKILPIAFFVFLSVIVHVVYLGLHIVVLLKLSGELPAEIAELFKERPKPKGWKWYYGGVCLWLGLMGITLYTRSGLSFDQRTLCVLCLVIYETDVFTMSIRDKTSKTLKMIIWFCFVVIFFSRALGIKLLR